jgi:hypothetical protein
MLIERSIEVGASAFADLAYISAAAFGFLSVVFLGCATWSAFNQGAKAGFWKLVMSAMIGLVSYQAHSAYTQLMITANGASSQPFYEMVLFIAVGSLGLLPIIALIYAPLCKNS